MRQRKATTQLDSVFVAEFVVFLARLLSRPRFLFALLSSIFLQMSQIRPGNGPSVTPNYVDPPTRPPAVQVTSIVFGAAVTASLVLRIYTRVHIKHRFEVDDIFAIFATVSVLALKDFCSFLVLF